MSERPQPVIDKAEIASGVTVAAAVATALGLHISDADKDTLTTAGVAVVAAVAVISHLVAAFRARRQVTPIADPVTATGEVLVPASAIPAPEADEDDDEADDDLPDQIEDAS